MGAVYESIRRVVVLKHCVGTTNSGGDERALNISR
jgi:hypothetical protein